MQAGQQLFSHFGAFSIENTPNPAFSPNRAFQIGVCEAAAIGANGQRPPLSLRGGEADVAISR